MSKPFSRRDFLKLLGTAAAAPLAVHLLPGISRQQNLPNVLILVFDTLSARHCSLYGYPRETTPNLKRFAEISTVYHNHWAAGNFTTPGTASLLTGVYPWEHRAIQIHAAPHPSFQKNNLFSVLQHTSSTLAYTHNPQANILLSQFRQFIDEWIPIPRFCISAQGISEHFFQKDFWMAYESEVGLLRNGAGPSGLLLGGHIHQLLRNLQEQQNTRQWQARFPNGLPSFMDEIKPVFLSFLLETIIDWLPQALQHASLAAYIHLLPPHAPYKPRAEFIDAFINNWQPPTKAEHIFSEGYSQTFLNENRRVYDEYIAYVDAEFGRLISLLRRNGQLENTLIVLTSDHGELFERGIYTHITPTLYEGLLHIPLLIHLPGQKTRGDVYVPTSAVDVLPTVAALLGIQPPNWVEGSPLPMGEGSGVRAIPPLPMGEGLGVRAIPPLPMGEGLGVRAIPPLPMGEGSGVRAIPPLPVGEGLGVRAISPLPVGEGLGVRAIFAIEAKESSKWGKLPKATFAMRIGDYKLIYYRGYPQLPEGWELYNLKNDPEELDNRFDSDPIAKDLQTYLLDTLMKKEL